MSIYLIRYEHIVSSLYKNENLIDYNCVKNNLIKLIILYNLLNILKYIINS